LCRGSNHGKRHGKCEQQRGAVAKTRWHIG
jgi:hypothetical protein